MCLKGLGLCTPIWDLFILSTKRHDACREVVATNGAGKFHEGKATEYSNSKKLLFFPRALNSSSTSILLARSVAIGCERPLASTKRGSTP